MAEEVCEEVAHLRLLGGERGDARSLLGDRHVRGLLWATDALAVRAVEGPAVVRALDAVAVDAAFRERRESVGAAVERAAPRGRLRVPPDDERSAEELHGGGNRRESEGIGGGNPIVLEEGIRGNRMRESDGI